MADASQTEQLLIDTAVSYADTGRRQGLLALVESVEEAAASGDLPELFVAGLRMIIDGDDWREIESVLEAGFSEQRHQLERQQRLVRTALEKIQMGYPARYLEERLSLLAVRFDS